MPFGIEKNEQKERKLEIQVLRTSTNTDVVLRGIMKLPEETSYADCFTKSSVEFNCIKSIIHNQTITLLAIKKKKLPAQDGVAVFLTSMREFLMKLG